jgi:hypothetical protein
VTALDVGILIVVAAMLAVVGLARWSGRRRTSYEEYRARHPQKNADGKNVAS